MDVPENLDDLKKQLLAERALRIEAERRMVGQELQAKTLQQELEKLTVKAKEQCLKQAEMEAQVREMQQQLSHELAKEAQLLCQAEEEHKQLREMKTFVADADFKYQTLQKRLLQKARECNDLQSQVTRELNERQKVQYGAIDSWRAILSLQMQLQAHESHNIMERQFVRFPPGPTGLPAEGVGDGSSYDFEGEGGASLWEPEGEDSACPAGSDSLISSRLRAPH